MTYDHLDLVVLRAAHAALLLGDECRHRRDDGQHRVGQPLADRAQELPVLDDVEVLVAASQAEAPVALLGVVDKMHNVTMSHDALVIFQRQ